MQFRLLGPLEVRNGDRPLDLGGRRQRAPLTLLLLHRNEVVSVDRIVDEIWEGDPPRTAVQVVRVYVSQLRKSLELDSSDAEYRALVTEGAGYALHVEPGELDVDRFDDLRLEGRRLLAAGHTEEAAVALGDALACWHGAPLQDVSYASFAQPEIARLEELRLSTLEDRFDAELASGRPAQLIADLERQVAAHPLRERARAQLMLALYRSGRQADALDVYREGRRLLVDELGIEPTQTLRELEAGILRQDPALDARAASIEQEADSGRRPSRRLKLVGALAAVAVVAAGAVALTAAIGTGGSARHRAADTSAVLVNDGSPSPSGEPPAISGPMDGLRGARKLGLQTTVLWGGGDDAGFVNTLDDAARNAGLVLVGVTTQLAAVAEVARQHPKTRFVVPESIAYSGSPFAGEQNVTGLGFDDRELGYLTGYLGALMAGRNGTTSAVGGVRTPAVTSLIRGFAAGAKRARPSVHVLVAYTDSFDDQALCENAANDQIDHGSRVVFDVAGQCGFGALQAAGIRGVWGIGVDDDLSYLGPYILVSAAKRGDRAIARAVTLFHDGSLPSGRDLHLGLASDGIGLVGISDRVPTAVRIKLERVARELRTTDQARGDLVPVPAG